MKFSIRLLYLYLFAFVGLLITVIGAIGLLDLTLKTYLFKLDDAAYFYPEPVKLDGEPGLSVEEQRERVRLERANDRKRQLSNNLAMILVGSPLYLYHWQTIKKENH